MCGAKSITVRERGKPFRLVEPDHFTRIARSDSPIIWSHWNGSKWLNGRPFPQGLDVVLTVWVQWRLQVSASSKSCDGPPQLCAQLFCPVVDMEELKRRRHHDDAGVIVSRTRMQARGFCFFCEDINEAGSEAQRKLRGLVASRWNRLSAARICMQHSLLGELGGNLLRQCNIANSTRARSVCMPSLLV
jgi:hypothetical protein